MTMAEQNVARYKEVFKDHIATLTDAGSIKIVDFKRPNSSEYRLRFLFEEDYCKLHISGDMGNLTASNYSNMIYSKFEKDFVHNVSYFTGKIDSCDRPLYYYDKDSARKFLQEHFAYEHFGDDDEESDRILEEKITEILQDFDDEKGLSESGFEVLSDLDSDAWEYAHTVGRERTGILEIYLLAFDMAWMQLHSQKDEVTA